MKRQLPAWAALCLIALVAGLLLGVTNAVTKDRIEQQAVEAANSARQAVLPEAMEFTQEELPEGAKVDNFYTGFSGGNPVGHTAQVTVKGYGGEIEITLGLNTSGVLTGISVGGANFSETQGLGARTKEADFTDRFKGITPPAVAGENVDTISGATISSGAVISGVNRGVDFILEMTGASPEEGAQEGPLPGATNPVEQPATEGIDKWIKADQGSIVTATAKGFGGNITVTVGIDNDGVITGVEIDAPYETPGLGERVMSDAGFAEQFIGKFGGLSFGSGVDALSGATISSGAVLEAINKALKAVG